MKPRFWPPQRQAEGQQQAVQMVELVQARQHRALDQHAGGPHQQRRDHERPPVAQPQPVQQQIGAERSHHVLRAVREVDDVQQAEDHRQPERQQGVERAVDQPDQQLPEQGLRGDAEDLHGECAARGSTVAGGRRPGAWLTGRARRGP